MLDTVFTPDSLRMISNIKRTIALLHNTMLQMQPIVERQLAIIQSQRILANIGLFFILVTFLLCVFFLIKHAQGVKSIKEMKIKKRFVVLFVSVWFFVIAIFNIVPGLLLMSMDQDINKRTVQDSQMRLYGNTK